MILQGTADQVLTVCKKNSKKLIKRSFKGKQRANRRIAIDFRQRDGQSKDDQRSGNRGGGERRKRSAPAMEPPAEQHDIREHDGPGREARHGNEHAVGHRIDPAARGEPAPQQLDRHHAAV